MVTMIMELFSFPVNTSKERQIIGPNPSALHPPSPQPSGCDLWPSRGDRSAIGEVTWKDIAINRWKNLLTINVGWKWSRLPSEKGNWPLSLTSARAAPADAWHQHGRLTSDASLSASEMLSFQAPEASD